MADHIITLTTGEEKIYQKYLITFGKTNTEIMEGLKKTLVDQVLQSINEAGAEKFKRLSVADKISFLT